MPDHPIPSDIVAGFDVDLSRFLYMAYQGKAGEQAALDLPVDRDAMVDLGHTIFQLRRHLDVFLADRFQQRFDHTMVDQELSLEAAEHGMLHHGKFELYDLGPGTGVATEALISGYNVAAYQLHTPAYRYVPCANIIGAHLVDLSEYFLAEAAKHICDELFLRSRCQLADITDLELEPALALNTRFTISDLGGGFVRPPDGVYRRVIYFGGNTINNIADPLALVSRIVSQMSRLDMLVIGLRTERDYQDYPDTPRRFIYKHAEQIGFSEAHTGHGSTIRADNMDYRSYHVTLAEPLRVWPWHPLLGKHPAFRAGKKFGTGTSFLLGYNCPISVDQLIDHLNRESSPFNVMAFKRHGPDALVTITYGPRSVTPAASGFFQAEANPDTRGVHYSPNWREWVVNFPEKFSKAALCYRRTPLFLSPQFAEVNASDSIWHQAL